jgi:hypothetical protein
MINTGKIKIVQVIRIWDFCFRHPHPALPLEGEGKGGGGRADG